MLTGEGTLDEVAVQILQDVGQVAESNGAHAVQDLLVALLGDNALLGVALAVAEAEQLLEDVLEVQLAAPAEALGKGQGHRVAVVDMGKGVSVNGALTGAAAGDDVVRSAGVQQHSGQDAVLNVGQLGGIVGGIHAVVDDLMAHRLDDLAQGGLDQGVLGGLAILIDQSDFHNIFSPFIVKFTLQADGNTWC